MIAGPVQGPPGPVRILLVDDDQDDYELTRSVVQQIRSFDGVIQWEQTYDAGLAALRRRQNDVCLLDYRLGARTGLELLAEARDIGCTAPIIVLTGHAERGTDSLAMRFGACDYLAKSELTANVLERSVRYALDRAHHTEELRRSEQRYKRIVETSQLGVWTIDANGKTTFMNARMAEMLRCDARAAVGESFDEFLDTGERVLSASRAAALQRGRSAQGEVRYVRKDGSSFHAWVESTPEFDALGNVDGVVTMVMDLTETKRAESARRVSDARFRRLWDSGLFLITVSDINGKIVDVNDAGTRMLGYSREELLSGTTGWRDLTPGEWAQASEAARAQLAATGVAVPRETEILRKDGSRVTVLLAAATLEGDEGIAVAVDLTESKGAKRVIEVLEAQLRQAQKMEAMGRLAGGVAHDFNNLLSVILSYSELLLAEIAPLEPMRDDIQEISAAGQRAAELTRQLLAFSRQQALEPRVLDLNGLLDGTSKMLHRLLGADVELESVHALNLGCIRADRGSLEQVVMNLAVNARDAMPSGGKLRIETENIVVGEDDARAHPGSTPGRYVVLRVSDTGTGMDAATRAHIFEPFYTTKEQGKGTGLGLSTVFGIVKQSGGSIAVESTPGKGTTFEIRLPSVDAGGDSSVRSEAPATLRGTETVLLVEDEDQVRAVAIGILRRRGYSVLDARNAGEAVLHCEQHGGEIHLLLSDVVMPQMSGPALARRLLRDRPGMRVLCMSGYTGEASASGSVVDPAFAFMQKPFTPDSLARKVREVLDATIPQIES